MEDDADDIEIRGNAVHKMSSATKPRYYKKRSGCATLSGPLYEIKMAALLFLRGVNSGLDFQLATNVDGAGALDDVVFRYKSPGGGGHWVTCFIQTKHTNRSKLSLEMLTTMGGDFGLPKYFEAYNEIRGNMASQTDVDGLFGGDFSNCVFVLFTNLESNVDFNSVSDKIPGELAGFLKAESGRVLSFNANGKTDVEREVLDCLGGGQDEMDFLNKLVVFCSQPRENEFDELIRAELETTERYANRSGINIDHLCDSFLGIVRDWCEEGKYILNKDSDILNGARDSVWAASCYHQESKNNTLGVFFKDVALLPLQNVLKEAFSVLLLETCECRLTATKLLRATREPCSILSLETFIEDQSRYELKWRKCKDKLVVLCVKQLPSSITLHNLIDTIRNVYEIAKQSDKRVVIVSGLESGVGLSTELTKEFKDQSLRFQDKFEFSQLEGDSQGVILQKAVLHQGYETTLLQTISDSEQLDKVLDAQSVIEVMTTDNRLSIGPDLADEIAYYIPRFVERATTVKDSILLGESLPESIAIVVSSIDDIKTLLTRVDKTISGEHFDEKILKNSQSDFEPDNENKELSIGEEFMLGTMKCYFIRLCHWKENEFVLRVYPKNSKIEEGICPRCFLFVFKETNEEDVLTLSEFCRMKHRLRYDGHSLQWTSSNGGDTNVMRAHICDTKVSVLDQQALVGLDDRLVLVSAEPGMGKSTLMTRLAKQEKEDSPFIWTIAISLCDQTTLFAGKVHEDVSEFLAQASGITSHLHKKLFKFALEVTGNVIVLLDGYDEVTPTYVNECCLLLSNLLKTKAKKIRISTRSSFQTKLEDLLSTLAVRLRKFDETDQRNFCKGFWKEARTENSTTAISEEELDDFITRLIGLMSRDIRDNEKAMLGIPLQTRMMAEIYQDHVTGVVEMPTLSKMDLLQLLEAFVDKKIRLDLHRQNVQLTNVNYVRRLEESEKRSKKKHMLAALISFFGPENVGQLISKKEITKSQTFVEEIKGGDDKTGIIENIFDKRPKFIHRVFTEYFVALWFTTNFPHSNYLDKVLYTTNFEIIRTFFDRILARDLPLHVSVLNEDVDTIREIITKENVQALDLGGRTVLHLAAAYGTSKNQKEIETRFHIIRILIANSHDLKSKKDEVLQSLPYRYADITQSWLTIEMLIPGTNEANNMTSLFLNPEDQNRLEFIFSHDLQKLMLYVLDSGLSVDHTLGDTGQRLLSRACYRGGFQVADALIIRNANINRLDYEDKSPLHIASMTGNDMLVNILCTAERFKRKKQGRVSSENLLYVNERDKHGRTALHLAAKEDHYFAVHWLLEFGADVTLRDDIYGSTPLHYAAVNDNSEDVIAKLISKSEDPKKDTYVNARTNYGETALHWAAREGCLSAVTALLKSGGQIDQVDFDGKTPLMKAAANGHADVVSYLINTYQGSVKTYIDKQDWVGMTAVQISASNGHSAVSVILINNGANFSQRDCYGETCLHKAARNANQYVVKDILEALSAETQCDLANLSDNFGKTALDLATADKNIEVMELLVKFGKQLTNIKSDHSIDQSQNSVKPCLIYFENKMIRQGKNFDSSGDEFGLLSLQVAAGHGLNDLVTELIATEDEADRAYFVNACDENGNTALHWASENEYPEMVDLLINSGAKVDTFNLNNETALTLAATKGNLDVIKRIFKSFDETTQGCVKGNFINLRDRDGWTAVHHASNEGHADVLAFLIDQGGDLRAIEKECRNTPLHFGTEEGHSPVVNVLINACPVGVRTDYVNTSNKYGDTALLLAAAETCVESVDLLIKAGSNICHSNHRGKTALMAAVENRNHETVKYLLESFHGLSQPPTYSENDDGLSQKPVASARSSYINLKDDDGLTALHLAANDGNKDAVVSLITHGANLRIRGGINDITPLHLACESCQCDVVKAILEELPKEETLSYVNSVGSDGNTALHFAACGDSVEIVSLLIQSGSSVFIENSNKDTPLSLAALNGQLEVMKCLLESCIGTKTKENYENTSECLKCPLSVIEYFNRKNSNDVNALGHAASEGHLDVFKYLINNGAEIDSDFSNCQSVSIPTLLHLAAEAGNGGIVKVIIDSLTNNKSRKMYSYENWHQNDGKWESTLVYFNFKDDYVDKTNYDYLTALYMAVEAGSLECVSHIVTAGGNVAIGDDFEQTPLMIAASNGNLDIVKYLVDNCNKDKDGFDKRDYVLMRDKLGRTAIEFAKEESHTEVLDFLIEFVKSSCNK